MTTPVQPYDEIQTILARNAGALADTVDRVAKAIGDRDQYELGAAQNVAAEQIGRILAYSDLLGRRRMTILAQAAEAPRVERYALAAAPAHLLGAIPKGGVLPEVKFEEAVEDIASRMPMVARGWRAVAELYQTRHAFACARAMTVAVTNRVQKIMADAIRGGDALPSGDAVSEIIQATGWDRSYAGTVYMTNSQTAYTAGIWARSSDPDVMAVIPGFRFVSQHLPTSRPNHEACAGLIAPTDSSLWNHYSPPLGFNCCDSVSEVTVFEAEREGLIRGGKMLSLLPPGLGVTGHADPGFGVGRPDRVALFGSFS